MPVCRQILFYLQPSTGWPIALAVSCSLLTLLEHAGAAAYTRHTGAWPYLVEQLPPFLERKKKTEYFNCGYFTFLKSARIDTGR
jgi:hypothetical protein